MVKLGEVVMIHDLRRQGLSISAIARKLGLDRKTVRHVQPSIKPGHLPSSLAMIAAGKKAPAEPGAKSRLRHLNEEIFDSLADARRTLALWRYDYNHVRPHSSLGNQTPAEARRALEQSEGSAPGALAQPETDHYQPQGLSL